MLSISFTFFGFIGLLVHRDNLFKMLVNYEIISVGLIMLFQFPAYSLNDANVLIFPVILITLLAADSAMGLCLLMVSSKKYTAANSLCFKFVIS